MVKMRAKMKVGSVNVYRDEQGKTLSESLAFYGVSKSTPYPADGSDEDNTFAKFSPSVELRITIANPDLFGMYAPGDTFYVDFTPAS